MDIVIIGGSLAGLWAAVAIKSLPKISSITILERYQEEQLQDLGAGIRVNNEAIAAILEFTGTSPEKYAVPIEAYRSLDLDGNLIGETLTKGWSSTWAQLYRVLRNRFESDSKCKYRHGCTLHHLIEEDRNHLVLTYLDDHEQQQCMIANMVIGADGASSKVRSLMLPNLQRTGSGYVVDRGLVYLKAGSFSHPVDSQFVSYPVPGNEAPADETEAVINWVWYQQKSEDELRQLLTDKQGCQHAFTLPVAGMRKDEIEKLREKTRQELPPQHYEVVAKTREPFAQLVTDSLSGQTCFFDGKLLLVGDAVGGQRPHTASAFLQCAFHGLMLRKLLQGDIDYKKWAVETQEFSSILVENGQELGQILMNKTLPQEKVPAYFKKFTTVQAQLHTKWETLIGIGGANPYI